MSIKKNLHVDMDKPVYYYKVGDVEYGTYLISNTQYSETEFNIMCEKTPKRTYGLSVHDVVAHLHKNHDFNEITDIQKIPSFNVDDYEDDDES